MLVCKFRLFVCFCSSCYVISNFCKVPHVESVLTPASNANNETIDSVANGSSVVLHQGGGRKLYIISFFFNSQSSLHAQ